MFDYLLVAGLCLGFLVLWRQQAKGVPFAWVKRVDDWSMRHEKAANAAVESTVKAIGGTILVALCLGVMATIGMIAWKLFCWAWR